tara:strand:- start:565 stop:735 length:171 start_codon:yes stop_codon:yes gene_type:complete
MLLTAGREFTLTLNGTTETFTCTEANAETNALEFTNAAGEATNLTTLEFSAAFANA